MKTIIKSLLAITTVCIFASMITAVKAQEEKQELYINQPKTDPDMDDMLAVFVLKGSAESIGRISKYKLEYVDNTFLSDKISINGTEVGIDQFKEFVKQFQLEIIDRRDNDGNPPEPPEYFTEKKFRDYFNSFNIFVNENGTPVLKYEEDMLEPQWPSIGIRNDLLYLLDRWAGFSIHFTEDISWDTDSVLVDHGNRTIWIDMSDPIAEVLREFNSCLLTSNPAKPEQILWTQEGRTALFHTYLMGRANAQDTVTLYHLWKGQYIKDMGGLVSAAAEGYINALEFIPIVGQGLEVVQIIAELGDGNFLAAALSAAPQMFDCAKAVKRIDFDLGQGLQFYVRNTESFRRLKNVVKTLEEQTPSRWKMLANICGTINKASDSTYLPRAMVRIFCFPEGTKVITSRGLVDISNVSRGDKVLAYDELTGQQHWANVQPPAAFQAESLVKFQYRIVGQTVDKSIYCTPDHCFGLEGPNHAIWVRARDLVEGDRLLTKDSQVAIVSDKPSWKGGEKVYSLHVPGYATYFIESDGILTHNISCYGSMKMLFMGTRTGKASDFAKKLFKYCGKSSDDMDPVFRKAMAEYAGITEDQVDGRFLRKYLIDDVDGYVNPFKQDLADAIRRGQKGKHEWCPVNNIDAIYRNCSNQTQFDEALDFMDSVRINTNELTFSRVSGTELINGKIRPQFGEITAGGTVYGHIGSGADLSLSDYFHSQLDDIFRSSFREGGSFNKYQWLSQMEDFLGNWFSPGDKSKLLAEIMQSGGF